MLPWVLCTLSMSIVVPKPQILRISRAPRTLAGALWLRAVEIDADELRDAPRALLADLRFGLETLKFQLWSSSLDQNLRFQV